MGDAKAIGRTFGTMVRRAGGSKFATGYDGRVSSPMLEAGVIEGLNEAGVDAVSVGLGPTPMLYYAAATLGVDGGIMVTGSHNPPDYNGFKMVFQGRPFFGEDIQKLGRMSEAGDWEDGIGEVTAAAIMDQYVDRLLEGSDGGAFRTAWDTGHGAAGPAVEKLTAKFPGEHGRLVTDVDANLPNHPPAPTQAPTLPHLTPAAAPT